MSRLTRALALLPLLALSLEPLIAQTRVHRYDVTKETDYGVVYRLPRTELEIILTVRERNYTPGELSAYADKYLNQEVEIAPQRWSEVLSAQVRSYGVPDMESQYMVVFDRKTIAPFVKLTDGGVLSSINGNAEPMIPELAPREALVSEHKPDRVYPALPREYAQAGTEAKKAEVAAGYLYEIREGLTNLATGAVDNMPKDGEAMRLAMEQLRREEQRSRRLFVGDTTERVVHYALRYQPSALGVKDFTLARFSTETGMKASDDLSGAPLRLSVRPLEPKPTLDEKEQKKREKLLENAVIYNVPGNAQITLSYEGRVLLDQTLPLAQLGMTQGLTAKMLNLTPGKTTAAYFDLATGALLRIDQE